MLKAAVAVADGRREEDIAVHRRRLAEEADLPLADRFEVGQQAVHVAIVAAGDGHRVGHAAGVELAQGEAAHLHGVVDQLVVVLGPVQAEAVALGGALLASGFRQAGGNAPAGVFQALGWEDVHPMGLAFVAVGGQKDAGAVEEAVGLVEVGAAHREIPGVNGVAQGHRAFSARRQLPAVLVEFGGRDGPASRLGRQADDVAGELADHVAAGNPRRQAEHLPGRVGLGELQADFEQVRGRLHGLDRVEDGSGHDNGRKLERQMEHAVANERRARILPVPRRAAAASFLCSAIKALRLKALPVAPTVFPHPCPPSLGRKRGWHRLGVRCTILRRRAVVVENQSVISSVNSLSTVYPRFCVHS